MKGFKNMENKTILLTGAKGFIGSNIYNELIATNNIVTSIDYISELEYVNSWQECIGEKKIKYDCIIHLAAQTDTRQKFESVQAKDVVDFAELIDFARENNNIPIVYASSAAVYGNETGLISPLNAYSRSKALIEILAQFCFKEIPSIGIRPFCVYGPGEERKTGFNSMVYQIIDRVKNGEEVNLFKHGEQSRDFVYIDDVVNCFIKAAELLIKGNCPRYSCFDCGSGVSTSYNELVRLIGKSLSKEIKVNYIDCPFDFFQKYTKAEIFSAQSILGHTPKWTIEQGIADFLKKWPVYSEDDDVPF